MRERIGPAAEIFAVVKADGYGHGAVPVARAALAGGAARLAVSTLAEAAEVSSLCAPDRVLIMGGLLPEDAAALAAGGFACVCSTPDLARALAGAATPARPVPVHVKIDSGMGRLGCAPQDAPALVAVIEGDNRLRLDGLMTHFASAETDDAFTAEQFQAFVDASPATGVLRHACNSAAAWRHPAMALGGVRIGIAMYGCEWPGARPALSLRSRVTQVKRVPTGGTVGYGRTWTARRDSMVAAVSIGYADGIQRARSGTGAVLVRGRRAPLAGRVSMDTLSVDVTDVPGVEPGDVVTIIGEDGGERITAEEVAGWSGTISWEVLTSIGARVERRYRE